MKAVHTHTLAVSTFIIVLLGSVTWTYGDPKNGPKVRRLQHSGNSNIKDVFSYVPIGMRKEILVFDSFRLFYVCFFYYYFGLLYWEFLLPLNFSVVIDVCANVKSVMAKLCFSEKRGFYYWNNFWQMTILGDIFILKM